LCVVGSNFSSSSHYGSHRTATNSAPRRPTHASGARHEVVLKSLPFYDVLGEIMKPSSLGNSEHISVLTFLLFNRRLTNLQCCDTVGWMSGRACDL